VKRRDLIAVIGGAAVAWPLAELAQQPGKVYRIALVSPSGSVAKMNDAVSPRAWRPFFDELRRQGFVEGRNLIVERYSGEGQSDRYADLARAVVASKPDAIYCGTVRMAAYLKAATETIPIVADVAGPIEFGLVSSLAHPGGNITGVSDAGLEFFAKHLELLRQAVPTASRLAYLTPREVWDSPLLAPVKDAARQEGVSLVPELLEAPIQEPEYRRVFALMAKQGVEGLIVGSSSENNGNGRLIVELAESARLPTLYPGRWGVEQGGLMSYGAVNPDLYRQLGADIAEILKGAKPGDIPFYQPMRFELVINLKTAKALGLTVPPSLLARADEVIE
jgi:putative tryptophan/tyrosine transport system substrate-binding protein